MKSKRFIALLLCAMLTVSLLPAAVFADGDEEIVEVSFEAEESAVLPEEEEPAQEAEAEEITDDEELPFEEEEIAAGPETEDAGESFDVRTIASGTCGAGLEWQLLLTGELVIAGSGPMDYYTADTSPWYPHKDSIKRIIIGDGVTRIGVCAFYSCSNLTSIDIPGSVTVICDNAFTYCTSITGITLPENLQAIGAGAFFGCSKLAGIKFPAKLTEIGAYAFKWCTAFTEITVPANVTSIGLGAFSFCENLKTAVINASVVTLPDSIFQEDTALESVSLPRGLKKISEHAFMKCSALNTVAFGGSKPEWDAINIVEKDNEPLLSAHITFALADNSCGPKLFWEFNPGNGRLEITGTGAMYDYSLSSDNYNPAPWFSHRNEITALVIHEGATTIGSHAFDSASIASVQMPEGILSIGDYAFGSNVKLKEIKIPAGVKSIGNNAFAGSGLTSINIPVGVTSIGEFAFTGCVGLKSVVLPDTLSEIGTAAFFWCSGIGKIDIPGSVKRIGNEAFNDCSALKEINFNGNAPVIGNNAFSGVTATAHYPAYDTTWTGSVMQQYGGKITWRSEPYIPVPVITTVANHADYMIVIWSKVEGAVSYRLAYREGSNAWNFVDVPLTMTDSKGNPRVNLRNLKQGATYTFIAYANFSDGTQTKSASAAQMRLMTPTVTAKAYTGYVNLTWNSVEGGSQYKIYYRAGGTWQLYAYVGKGVTSVNIKESVINANGWQPLYKGVKYEFAVLTATSVAGITSGFPTNPVSVVY